MKQIDIDDMRLVRTCNMFGRIEMVMIDDNDELVKENLEDCLLFFGMPAMMKMFVSNKTTTIPINDINFVIIKVKVEEKAVSLLLISMSHFNTLNADGGIAELPKNDNVTELPSKKKRTTKKKSTTTTRKRRKKDD